MTSLIGRSWLVNYGPDTGSKVKRPFIGTFYDVV